MSSYDPNNLFAKILLGEIPCGKVYEDDHVLAFKDINPQALTHILIVPRKPIPGIDQLDPKCADIDLVRGEPRRMPVRRALVHAAGLGAQTTFLAVEFDS